MKRKLRYSIALIFCLIISIQTVQVKGIAPAKPDSLRHPAKSGTNQNDNLHGLSKSHPYRLSIRYKYDHFNKIFSPWNEWSIELKHQIKWGTLIGRVNDASRFSHNGTQLEMDAYPVFRKGTYAYLNAGFSNGSVYPNYRLGASVYQAIPAHFVLGAGVRSMFFASQNVVLLTGTISKYVTNYYLAVHPYIDPNKKNQSVMLLIRRYLANSRNYIQVMAGAGSTPFGFNTNQDLTRLNSRNIELLLKKDLTSTFLVEAAVGFEREEYRPNTFRDRYHAEIAVSYRF
ncbi:MAG TPA: YaiO family outer membrane beta-barrel protein [Balneolales bacterium]|nr:YaiO family outer membrane beta-barrel protein [Balneolales bacterium]